MTVKRNDDGVLELVKSGMGSNTFRVALIAAFVSQTPLADGVWKTFGMKSLSVQMGELNTKADSVVNQVNNIQQEVSVVKSDFRQVHTHLETMEQKFGAFEVDFRRAIKETK